MFDQDIFVSECSMTQPGHQHRNMSNQHSTSIFNCLDFHFPLSPPSQITHQQPQLQSDLGFVQVDFFSTQHQEVDEGQATHLSEMSSICQPSSKCQEQNKQKEQKKRGANNNLTNYILKHCFKQIITKDFKAQIEGYCKELSITYAQFLCFWEKQQEQNQNKHIGVNYFLKMMKGKTPFIQVLRYFLIVYLRCHYPHEVLCSNKQKKQQYLAFSVKILYLVQLPRDKCYQLIRQAQTGLDH